MPDQAAIEMIGAPDKAPSLSATSDMPVVVQATETAVVETTETKTEVTDTSKTDTVPETETAEGDKTDKKSGINERFSKMAEQRRTAEARADRLERTLGEALTTIRQLAPQPQNQTTVTVDKTSVEDPRPKREAFTDPDAYDGALIEWSTRQATRVAKANSEKEALEATQRQSFAEATSNFQARRQKVVEEHPDFDEVVYADDLRITEVMRNAMLMAENSAEVAYHLGRNKAEALRIAGLPPMKQALEIGRLSATLSAPVKPVSTASAPIRPLNGTANAANPKTPDQESMDEYAARRNREEAEKRSRARVRAVT